MIAKNLTIIFGILSIIILLETEAPILLTIEFVEIGLLSDKKYSPDLISLINNSLTIKFKLSMLKKEREFLKAPKIQGIPVFTLAPVSAALPVGSNDLTKIETPHYPTQDVLWAWGCHLAHGQFHDSELRTGKAKAYLEETWT